MAKQTAAQKKAADQKAAEAKAKATDTTTQPATTATAEALAETKAKTDTETKAKAEAEAQAKAEAEAEAEAQAKAEAEAKAKAEAEALAKAEAEAQAQAVPSVFDQAVQFSMNGHSDGSKASRAKEIWDALGCDHMPAALAVAAFDCAVAQGEEITPRLLGKVGIDIDTGKIEHSVEAALERQSVDELVLDFLSWRLRRYASTGNAGTKMREWAKHILQLQAFVLSDLQTG